MDITNDTLPSDVVEQIMSYSTTKDVFRYLATSKDGAMMKEVAERKAKTITQTSLKKIIDNVIAYNDMFNDSDEIDAFMKQAIQKYRMAFFKYAIKTQSNDLSADDAFHFACHQVIWDHLRSIVNLDIHMIHAVLRQVEEYPIPTVVDLFPEGVHAPVMYKILKEFFVGKKRTWEISFSSAMYSFAFDIVCHDPERVLVKMLVHEKKVEQIEEIIRKDADKSIRMTHECGFYKLMFEYSKSNMSVITNIIHTVYGNNVFSEGDNIVCKLQMKYILPSVATGDTSTRLYQVYINSFFGKDLRDFHTKHFKSVITI